MLAWGSEGNEKVIELELETQSALEARNGRETRRGGCGRIANEPDLRFEISNQEGKVVPSYIWVGVARKWLRARSAFFGI